MNSSIKEYLDKIELAIRKDMPYLDTIYGFLENIDNYKIMEIFEVANEMLSDIKELKDKYEVITYKIESLDKKENING